MLNRPPRHRADAVPVYVDVGDGAWDWKRVEDDRNRMLADGGDPDMHPVTCYFSGESRYDLTARYNVCGELKSATDYLDLPQAWQFVLRRLSPKQFFRVKSMWTASADEAALLAAEIGLERIDGPEAPRLRFVGEHLSEANVAELFEVDPGLLTRVGQAVFYAALPLVDNEKKA